MSAPTRYGFTLLELSIVLVIIGLIVGGIMTGKVLIQQAEIRAAASQYQKLETAYRTFQTKYNCIMGDCANATDFFGANYITGTGCTMAGGMGNGDGNGIIDSGSGGGWYCEEVQAIRSLALANILPASSFTPCWGSTAVFRGLNDSCGYFYNDDLNGQVPATKQNSVEYAVLATDGTLLAPVLSPMQARSIDEKIDDGIPNKGKFRGLDTSALSGWPIIANSCSASGVYNLNDNASCRTLYYFK